MGVFPQKRAGSRTFPRRRSLGADTATVKVVNLEMWIEVDLGTVAFAIEYAAKIPMPCSSRVHGCSWPGLNTSPRDATDLLVILPGNEKSPF